MKEWLKTGSIPADRMLKSDLTAPKQELTSTGQNNGAIKLESKSAMKSRGVASPDAADALALTFAFPVASKGTGRSNSGRGGSGYDTGGRMDPQGWMGS
jgi:phage terminase large subunit